MKILFDHYIFSSQVNGGITSYFQNIYKYITENTNHEVKISYLITSNSFLKSLNNNNFFIKCLLKILPNKRRVYTFINNFYYLFVKQSQIDIYHSTLYSKKKISSSKKIITIHDMIPELYNWKKNPHKNKYQSANESDLIISVSNKTKEDIIKIYGFSREKIVIIPNSIDFNYWKIKSDSKFQLKNKYFLYVGDRISPHKNFDFLLDCFSNLIDKNILLICCGGGPLSKAEKKKIDFLKLNKNLFVYDDIHTNDLKFLYKNSLAYVSVSIDEGFGIPALEAFASGTNIILNDIEIYREIFLDDEFFFKNNNKDSFIKKMKYYKNNNVKNRNLARYNNLFNKYHSEIVLRNLNKCYENLIYEKK